MSEGVTKQSRLMSLVEAVANLVVGYGIAVVTQLVVFPWFGLPARIGDAIAIGAIFTAVSITRSYLLRRLFETLRPTACSAEPEFAITMKPGSAPLSSFGGNGTRSGGV